MRLVGNITRNAFLCAIWFGGLVGVAALATVLLADPYLSMGLSVPGRVISTMTLAAVGASALTAAAWVGYRRTLMAWTHRRGQGASAAEAALAEIG